MLIFSHIKFIILNYLTSAFSFQKINKYAFITNPCQRDCVFLLSNLGIQRLEISLLRWISSMTGVWTLVLYIYNVTSYQLS
jgi:hypothetical protein